MPDKQVDYNKIADKKKFWMFVHVTARRLLEGLFVSSSMMVLYSVLTGNPVSIVFICICLLSLLVRVWVWARDIDKYKAIPEYDYYRLYHIEQKLSRLEAQLRS